MLDTKTALHWITFGPPIMLYPISPNTVLQWLREDLFFIKASVCFWFFFIISIFVTRLDELGCMCLFNLTRWTRAATGIRCEWPLAQLLGVTTARWVGVALWEMEYIKGVLHNGRFLGSTEHQCYSTWHPHWKELQYLVSGRCPGSVGRSELMVRSQLDVLKQQPLHWSRSPFLLAGVHQSNALWESRVIIALSERQDRRNGPAITHLTSSGWISQKLSRNSSGKQLFLGPRPRVLCCF